MPNASSSSRMIGTCTLSASGTISTSTPASPLPAPPGASRCVLYDGMSRTRQAGRQSSSRAQMSRPGRRVRISVATKSRKPRTALTGVPSGARAADSGMPKNARKYRLAESTRRRGAVMGSLRVVISTGNNDQRLARVVHAVYQPVLLIDPPREVAGQVAGKLLRLADAALITTPDVADEVVDAAEDPSVSALPVQILLAR